MNSSTSQVAVILCSSLCWIPSKKKNKRESKSPWPDEVMQADPDDVGMVEMWSRVGTGNESAAYVDHR